MATSSLPPLSGAPPSTIEMSTKKKPTFPPNQTLYVTNLPTSKVQKQDIRRLLYILFSTYGPVLDVVALKTLKMRGQAHIVFRDMHAATQAKRALSEFEFLGSELKIEYAKSKSDTIAKLDGTFARPMAKGAEVIGNETQQSIFAGPPVASTTAPLGNGSILKKSTEDEPMDEAGTPAADSVAGQKRRREDDDDGEREAEPTKEEFDEEGSEGDAAMEEDSDDD